MKLLSTLILVVLGGLITFLFVKSVDDDKSFNDRQYQSDFNRDYRIYAIPLDEEMSFAGETAPLKDFEVRERIDREVLVNSYWQSSSLQYIKNANRWFPQIEKILKEEGVPDDFKYLPLIESGMKNVVSPASARGYWQFLKSTAQSYGLEVNNYVDERYNPLKSTRAACQYLKEAHEKFGSWTMAAASYNMGMAGLKKAVNSQGCSDYYNLYLNDETARYVPRLLAVKMILSNPGKYGFYFRDSDLYKELKSTEMVVDTTIRNLADFAEENGISYKHLKVFNPWLRSTSLPNSSQKKYTFSLPNPSALNTGTIEKDSLLAKQFANSTKLNIKFHIIKQGENIATISELYELPIDSIIEWNSLQKQGELPVGKELIIQLRKQ